MGVVTSHPKLIFFVANVQFQASFFREDLTEFHQLSRWVVTVIMVVLGGGAYRGGGGLGWGLVNVSPPPRLMLATARLPLGYSANICPNPPSKIVFSCTNSPTPPLVKLLTRTKLEMCSVREEDWPNA